MARPSFDRRYLLLLLLVPVLLIGTCGGDDDTFRTDRPALRLELDEYRISPQDVEVGPGRLKLIVRNTGRLTHNFRLEIPAGDEDEEAVEVAQMDTAQPGQVLDPVKVFLRPGTYRMVCTIANHDDLGQYGELHVEE